MYVHVHHKQTHTPIFINLSQTELREVKKVKNHKKDKLSSLYISLYLSLYLSLYMHTGDYVCVHI